MFIDENKRLKFKIPNIQRVYTTRFEFLTESKIKFVKLIWENIFVDVYDKNK